MMFVKYIWLIGIIHSVCGLDEDQLVSYDGYSVLEATHLNPESLSHLQYFLDHNEDILQLHANRITGALQLAVPPAKKEILQSTIRSLNTPFTIELDNLGSLFPPTNVHLRKEPISKGMVTFERYMNYNEINDYIKDLPKRYPEQVSRKVIGQTYLGKKIHMLSITNKRISGFDKPVVLIDGGIHAREWVSPAAVLYVIERLLVHPSLINNIEWQIMPLLNPDGYEYSWDTDRLWRKNRSKMNGAKCRGVDLNRNFDSHWMETGASQNPCSDVYAGTGPFSEAESQALRDTYLPVKKRVKAYISVHSYGQMILYPYGYTNKVKHPKEAKLETLGHIMADAIKNSTREHYIVDTAGGALYTAAGGSDDYMAEDPTIYSYTFELRDKGQFGFVLPESDIGSSGEDLWQSINVLGKHLLKKFGPSVYRETEENIEVKEEPKIQDTSPEVGKQSENPVIPRYNRYSPLLYHLLRTDGLHAVPHPSVYIPTPILHYEVPHLFVPYGAVNFR